MAEQLSITGRVNKVLPVESGQGKNGAWERQMFVIETEGQYPKLVAFTTFGEMVSKCPTDGNIGDSITVFFNPSSREYNGKYYTELQAWKITGVAAKSVSKEEPRNKPSFDDEKDDIPF